jgi:phosphatidylserine/phosphatidylglycerophosphate/cardiolipin synthase-like enzyme
VSAPAVFFFRPAGGPSQEEIRARMRNDLARACRRAAIVSAWFTDTEIAEALIAAPAPRCCKYAILNRADLSRDRKSRAYPQLADYFARSPLSAEAHDAHWAGSARPGAHGLYGVGQLTILGSEDWVEGVMHHKIVLADDVVWTGSYNLTFAARRNYETLLRFADPAVAGAFWAEVDALAGSEEELWNKTSGSQFPGLGGRFRCCDCFRLKPAAEAWDLHDGSNVVCQTCGDGRPEWEQRRRQEWRDQLGRAADAAEEVPFCSSSRWPVTSPRGATGA